MRGKLKCSGHVPDTTQVLLCIGQRDKKAELESHRRRLAIAFGLIWIRNFNPCCEEPSSM